MGLGENEAPFGENEVGLGDNGAPFGENEVAFDEVKEEPVGEDDDTTGGETNDEVAGAGTGDAR